MFIVQKENLIYEVKSPRVVSSKDMSLEYPLQLVCGIEYIDPDYSDKEGWVDCSRFVDELQEDNILVLYDEDLSTRLCDDGYIKLDKLPHIHSVKVYK